MVCSLWGSRGSNHSGVLVGDLDSGLVYASYLKSGTRSTGLAKSKLALLHDETPPPFTLILEHE